MHSYLLLINSLIFFNTSTTNAGPVYVVSTIALQRSYINTMPSKEKSKPPCACQNCQNHSKATNLSIGWSLTGTAPVSQVAFVLPCRLLRALDSELSIVNMKYRILNPLMVAYAYGAHFPLQKNNRNGTVIDYYVHQIQS